MAWHAAYALRIVRARIRPTCAVDKSGEDAQGDTIWSGATMAGEIEAYLRARKAFEQIANDIEELAEEVVEIGECLRDDPTDISFDNAGVRLSVSASRTFDAKDWKSAQEIQTMLAQYHTAMDDMHSLWKKVPADLRDGLMPPVGTDWNG
jgi:hypothetical protein